MAAALLSLVVCVHPSDVPFPHSKTKVKMSSKGEGGLFVHAGEWGGGAGQNLKGD